MQKLSNRRSSTYLTCRRWTAEEAGQALIAWEDSGLELTAFATGAGLDPQRLTRWRRRLATTGSPTFEEVLPCVALATVESDALRGVAGERFEVVLPSGGVGGVPGALAPGGV